MKKDNAFLLVEDDSTYNYMIDAMFDDILKQKDVYKFVEKRTNSFVPNLLKKNKIQKFTNGKLNFLLSASYKIYEEMEKISKEYNNVFVIFLNSSFLKTMYPHNVLSKYKKELPNVKYVLFYIDIVNHPVSHHANILRENGIFDKIYTVDFEDSKKYNMIFWNTPYSKIEKFQNIQMNKELYFCGVTKNRTNQLLKVLEKCKQENINVKMDIVCKEEEKNLFEIFRDNVNIYCGDDFLKYQDVLKKSLQASCILEIVQDGQVALTLRPYEAVTYNRKLLTNNKTILKYKYYNPLYMQYFEKIEDINWDWLKKREEFDFNYKGEFSPNNLLKDIIV